MSVPLTTKPLSSRIMRKMLNLAEKKSLFTLQSFQLKRSLRTFVDFDTPKSSRGALNVPHYWAGYYHDGRKTITKESGFLIWFKNPRNDPRLRGGNYPVNKSQVRKISKADLAVWSARNRKIISRYKKRTGKRSKDLTKTDYRRMDLPMIVAKRSRMAKSHPFFSNQSDGGMYGFGRAAGRLAEQEVYQYVEERLQKSGLKNKRITRIIR